jgi:hypothetical protein
VTRESVPGIESPWIRCLGILAAAFVALYSFIGAVRNDLLVSFAKSDARVHLHGPLAWVACAGMIMMAVGVIRILGPGSGDDAFNLDERRQRYRPLAVLGLVICAAARGFATWGH